MVIVHTQQYFFKYFFFCMIACYFLYHRFHMLSGAQYFQYLSVCFKDFNLLDYFFFNN